MAEFATRGVGNTALGLSIGSLASQLLTGQFGNVLNGTGNGNSCGCSEDRLVNRYEMGLVQENESLKSSIALRDANTYTMNELNRFRTYVDGKFDAVNAQLCAQNVTNTQIAANLSCMQNNIANLMGLTKTVIPITSVCPEPMPALNSWTAPTATT